MQRAVSDQQKEQRRRALLDAARRLFESTSYGEISMAAVAREADVAKGTVYLYFDSKEALFLELQEETFTEWFQHVASTIRDRDAEEWTVESVADLLSRSVAQRPTFVRLIAVLHTVLEQNIDLETATRFKQTLIRGVRDVAAPLEEQLSFLSPGDGRVLLLRLHALVIGFQHMANPAPVVAEALKTPALAPLDVEFETSLHSTIRTVLHGMKHQ